jgi:hypothetical protein
MASETSPDFKLKWGLAVDADWTKSQNPAAPAVRREAEESGGSDDEDKADPGGISLTYR